MLRLAIFLMLPLMAAAAPNRYIVELEGEPVAGRLARGTRRIDFNSAAARREREAVRTGQRRSRREIERRGRVLESVDTVANALIVEIEDSEAQALERAPGVKRVRRAREFRLLLDRALPLHRIPEAWSMVGAGNAGAGVKIGIIDTGIDSSHPAFDDPSMTAPPGYPLTNQESDVEFTNGKVIVARSYTSLLRRRDPDPSARDRGGHGTATAMAAAGRRVTAPLAVIEGVAPRAWLGSYKVFGSPGTNDLASEEAVIKAIDDAVADGMDVINLSLGTDLASSPDEDLEVQAIERAARAGVIVVVAAGNNGGDPNTIAAPATAPSAIAVGASASDRFFAGSVQVAGLGTFAALPGSGSEGRTAVNGPLADVSTLDRNGLACAAMPADSLRGRIALILRGTCTFEEKLNQAEAAGAIGAVVYTDEARPDPLTMSVGGSRLPAAMVSYSDGARMKSHLAAGDLAITMEFTPAPHARSADAMADFSAAGPSVDLAVKPELVAVGVNFYTAAQRFDPQGEIFHSSGFAVEQGTSFSAPLVAGAAAVLKAARPGLTAAQYRSLLVNTSVPVYSRPGTFATVQQAGAGGLDLSAALRTTVAASPVAVSFGSLGPDPDVTRSITISNTGTTRELFRLVVTPTTNGPVPQLARESVELAPGFAADIPITFRGASLAAGHYEGFVYIQGTVTRSTIRMPYWYAAASHEPRHVTLLAARETGTRGASLTDAIVFRVTDASGLPVRGVEPTVTVVSGGGEVINLANRSRLSPGAFGATVRLGSRSGANTFRIEAGGISRDVTITAP
jgi:subtilisin family serine protease